MNSINTQVDLPFCCTMALFSDMTADIIVQRVGVHLELVYKICTSASKHQGAFLSMNSDRLGLWGLRLLDV